MTAWERVRAALLTYDESHLVTVITGLTREERREVIRELPAYQRERRQASQWQILSDKDRVSIRLAGVGCAGGPAAATTWLFRRGLEVWTSRGQRHEFRLAQVVADRPVEWRVELARRVSARLPVRDVAAVGSNWTLAARLLREAGAEPPSDDGFVIGWIQTPSTLPGLRDDPFLDALTPLLFEADGVGRLLNTAALTRLTWEGELTALAEEGRLKRETLLDGCLRRFLRGGSPTELKWFVRLHEALAPTPDEARERARDYLRLLPAAPAPVAEAALRQVCRIDQAGGLDEASFAEAAEAILFRPEKKPVRAALSWLGRTAPRRVDATLVALTVVFGQESTDLRERAVKLIVKFAPKAGDDALRTVREAAATLPADLRERVAAACGPVASSGPAPEAVGVAPFTPRPLPAPIGSVAELAEETARLFRSHSLGMPEGERLLAGLVHFAYHAPEETRAALRRVVDAAQWGAFIDSDVISALGHPGQWFDRVIGAAIRPPEPPRGGLRGALSRTYEAIRVRTATSASWQEHRVGVPQRMLFRRVLEISEFVGRTPLLLSTPTAANGQVDPAELVARLERLEEAGLRPGDADLEQALLRLPRSFDPGVVLRAQRLSSPAGRTTAKALASGGLPDPRVVTEPLTLPRRKRTGYSSQEVEDVTAVLATVRPSDPSDPSGMGGMGGMGAELFRLPADGGSWTRVPHHDHVGVYGWWPSVLPSHREVIAAHLLPFVPESTDDSSSWYGEGEALLALAEADGPAGDALATVLAFRLGARDAEERSAAVDALLVLAGRGQAPAAELGVALGRLIRHRLVKPNRIAEALTGATDAGAAAEVWTAISTALPGVLPGDGEKARQGVPDLLALATRCAEATGARIDLPELTAVASRGGSSRLVQEAGRLVRVAGGGH